MSTTPNADAMAAHARTVLERRRTIEARLDRLKKRLDRGPLDPSALAAVLKGTLDLLTDVLLEDEPR